VTLAAAVIGLGVGEQHARALAAHPRARVAWLLDLDRGRAEALSRVLGQGEVANDYATVLADPAVDVVVLASYDDDHAAQVVSALHAGKHVFCEKPLCRTPAELDAIATARGDRHLGCNLVLRAAPLFRWLRDAIRGGELGEIYALDGDYLYGRLHKITDGWRGSVDDYSVIQGGGVHLVDLMMWLLGERPSSVTAVGNRIVTRDTAFRYPDFVAATYELPSGAIGRITANFGCVHKHQHVLRVFGTKATFIADDGGARLHVARDPGAPPRVLELAPVAASKGDLVPGFIDGVLDHVDAGPAARHELDVMSACMFADRALVAQQRQRIEYRHE
jgi:predicted dehydrogenase